MNLPKDFKRTGNMLDYMNFFLYVDGNFVQSSLQLVLCVLTAAADYTLAWL